ncbi:CU044_2847 family protein [Streptomyces hygroscopicus]|uniref:CU044_2847 family protein n=1 Tax=Streptomyces hygroscopicus TaxID=1912 RepID=UPI002240A53C|nr:CU044_2847 family protein [Streptomyces hygroscopicus]
MSEIVQVETPEGSLWVRIEERGGPRDTAFGGRYRLDDLPGTLQTVVGNVRSGLRRAAPDEVTLEFGIELAIKAGALVSAVTSAGGKTTLKVSATWRKGGEPDLQLTAAGRPEEPDEANEPDSPVT